MDDTSSSICSSTNESSNGVHEKDDSDPSEVGSAGAGPVEVVSSETSDSNNSTMTKSVDSTSQNYEGVSPEKVLRKGILKWIDFKNFRGVLIQDEEYRDIGPVKTDEVLLHFDNIYPEWKGFIVREKGEKGRGLIPKISRNARFQFHATKQSKKNTLMAYYLRYEGGKDIPLIHWKGSLDAIKLAKSSLGIEVYNILSKASSSGTDKRTISKQVNRARSSCMKRIRWARNQITNPDSVAMERKAELGNDIWELMANIANVDNIERRADDAYYSCIEDLSSLGLDTEPNNTKDGQDEEEPCRNDDFETESKTSF
eukprot:CAMPEP_0181138584 /NCGR_PEP_ID=MMETSP1071-20121207/34325_1 /TAXON_ID=35127 /ORGANISM="Thalassiosira sp., Strain NH16" /LENGTH=312 /DNA_ID=CAMNT_0023225431 /DNA_START=202 /DNA_END=1140 /DNA_ORIENTATION=+